MKIVLTFKSPETYQELQRQLYEDLDYMLETEELTEEEKDHLYEEARAKAGVFEDFIRNWVKYSEYISIEFDDEAGTATVLRTKE